MRCLLISIATLFLLEANAQNFKTVYKVVPIMNDQKFYLNGGARADFGGKSREILLVNLPPNTVEWYYAFTSSIGQNETQSIHLAAQLISLLAPQEAILANIGAKLVSPSGAGVCDVYLFRDQPSVNDFVAKKGQIVSDLNGTRENFKQGVVRIKDALMGPYVLGIRNPSALEGVKVSIEIVAVVAQKILVTATPSQDEASLYDEVAQKAFSNGEYDKTIEYEKKALDLDSTFCTAASRLALTYLVAGKPETVNAYIKAIDLMKRSSTAKKNLGESIRDLQTAERKFGNLKDLDLINNLLLTEYAKL